jgi:hypothetical protein
VLCIFKVVQVPFQHQLEYLSSSILSDIQNSKEDIALLSLSQNFAKHADLALAYYHLCSIDPNIVVSNNESFNGHDGNLVCERIAESIGEPIGQADAAHCQESAFQHDPSSGRIAASASCNEIWTECEDQFCDQKRIHDLPLSFHLTPLQLLEMNTIPVYIVRRNYVRLTTQRFVFTPKSGSRTRCDLCCTLFIIKDGAIHVRMLSFSTLSVEAVKSMPLVRVTVTGKSNNFESDFFVKGFFNGKGTFPIS